MLRPSLLRTISGLAIAGLIPFSVNAQSPRDVSSEIDTMRPQIAYAELFTVPTIVTFRHTLHERDVVHMGCAYTSVDQRDIDALLDLLRNARLTQQPDNSNALDIRTVIYLHDKNGRTHALALTPEYVNAPATGSYDGRIFVVAKVGFGPALLTWKKERKPIREAFLMCQDEVPPISQR
jgi:hypothetical protein